MSATPRPQPDNILSDSLADVLRTVIQEQNKRVAHTLGVQESRVSEWLRGKDSNGKEHRPSILCLAQLVNEYVGGDDSERINQFLRLLLLENAGRLGEDVHDKTTAKWLSQAKGLARRSIQLAYQDAIRKLQKPKVVGRTLADFPDAFYPLVVVTGDKREESEARITKADFGAVSASPAEARWIFRLGLRQDVEFFSDKILCLEGIDRLKDRFGKKNILVIGSPGSNHLARRLHLTKPPPGWRRGVPVFRFNQLRSTLAKIEQFQETLNGLSRGQLRGKQADPQTADNLKYWLHELFQGGVLDLSNHHRWKRGTHIPHGADFGMLTLARNPFSDPADGDRYVCILAAGFHLFGTAHAVQFLAHPEQMSDHPLGGVIHIDIDQEKPFSVRLDESLPRWDTNSQYTVDRLREGIKLLRQEMSPELELTLTKEELQECADFIDAL